VRISIWSKRLLASLQHINSLDNIQPALRDRMEIIEVKAIPKRKKVEIAKKTLLVQNNRGDTGVESHSEHF